MTRLDAGIADNVIPDRAVATLNFRYAPDRTPERREPLTPLAHSRRRRARDHGRLTAGARRHGRPLLRALRDAGDLAIEPKQAWTNVADFTTRGIDAVNFGPGATRYAHRRDELVEVAALVRPTTRSTGS